MLTSDSAAPRWLATYAAQCEAPWSAPVTPALFDADGAKALWEWAMDQRGPIAASDSPWLTFAYGAPAWVVLRTLPIWVGILALHPSPASMILKVSNEVTLVAPFAEHARREWTQILLAGGDRPPTVVGFVPRNGDWARLLPPANTWANVPVQGRIERMPSAPPPSARRRRRRRK